MRELIVYATPTGALADACERYFAAATELGGTTAQTYPPHCTLTGFFQRGDERVDEVTATVQQQVHSKGPLVDDAVRVSRIGIRNDWIGLELDAPDLITWTESLAADLPPHPGEDALRPKTWLHLSLAYGVDDLAPYSALLPDDFDHHLVSGRCQWELALWERTGPDWHRLTH